VLPLLRDTFVVPGWVSDNTFLAGYGAPQAVPGPLFTFAAYLGALLVRHRMEWRAVLTPTTSSPTANWSLNEFRYRFDGC
jgi:chromate transport protein ChrA